MLGRCARGLYSNKWEGKSSSALGICNPRVPRASPSSAFLDVRHLQSDVKKQPPLLPQLPPRRGGSKGKESPRVSGSNETQLA